MKKLKKSINKTKFKSKFTTLFFLSSLGLCKGIKSVSSFLSSIFLTSRVCFWVCRFCIESIKRRQRMAEGVSKTHSGVNIYCLAFTRILSTLLVALLILQSLVSTRMKDKQKYLTIWSLYIQFFTFILLSTATVLQIIKSRCKDDKNNKEANSDQDSNEQKKVEQNWRHQIDRKAAMICDSHSCFALWKWCQIFYNISFTSQLVVLIIFWPFLWTRLPNDIDIFFVVAHHSIPQAVLFVDFMLNQVQVNLKMSLFIILYVLIYSLYAVYYTLTGGPVYPKADLKSL